MSCVIEPIHPDGYRPDCFTGNGSTRTFALGFDYIGKSSFDGSKSPYIRVFLYETTLGILVEQAGTTWTMPTSASINLATAPTSTQRVWIIRDSSVNGRLVDFEGGATVSESNLDLDSLQAFYLWEESAANLALLDDKASDKNYFGLEYEFTGDGSTVSFTLDDGENAVDIDLSKISLWIFVNGVFLQSDDYSVAQNTADIAVVTLGTAPETGDDILIRVAQQNSLAVQIDPGSIGNDELANGSVTFEKLDLDGEGTDKQVAGWTGGGGTFGPNTLDHTWISDFDAGVQANRLNSLTQPNGNLTMNGKKITNLLDPTDAQDAATKSYVDGLGISVTSGSVSIRVNNTQPSSVAANIGFNPTLLFLYIEFNEVSGDNNYSQDPVRTFMGSAESSGVIVTVNAAGDDPAIPLTLTKTGTGFTVTRSGTWDGGDDAEITFNYDAFE
jgi:hypothetical protein